MRISQILTIMLALICLSLPACRNTYADQPELEHRKIVITSPAAKDVIITERYVCQIHSQRHIKVRSLQSGYLEAVPVKEGQAVKKGDVLFKVLPILYKARLDTELAEVKLAELELGPVVRNIIRARQCCEPSPGGLRRVQGRSREAYSDTARVEVGILIFPFYAVATAP